MQGQGKAQGQQYGQGPVATETSPRSSTASPLAGPKKGPHWVPAAAWAEEFRAVTDGAGFGLAVLCGTALEQAVKAGLCHRLDASPPRSRSTQLTSWQPGG